jgi:hypothetical protein
VNATKCVLFFGELSIPIEIARQVRRDQPLTAFVVLETDAERCRLTLAVPGLNVIEQRIRTLGRKHQFREFQCCRLFRVLSLVIRLCYPVF